KYLQYQRNFNILRLRWRGLTRPRRPPSLESQAATAVGGGLPGGRHMVATAPGRPDLAAALGEFPVFAGLPAAAMATLTAGAGVETIAECGPLLTHGDE